ncbi:MAG: ABC transporter permease [Bacteroidales bacterium]|nr:ABC transporter permease [Bacteroidales bacterium]
MNKLFIIIKREYLSKVCKKSFFVLTVLGPVLLALLIVLPAVLKEKTQKTYNITVVDSIPKTVINSDTIAFFQGKFKSNETVNFSYESDISKAQQMLKDNKTDLVLEIVKTNDNPPIKTFSYFADNEPSLEAKEEVLQQTKQIFRNSVLMVNYDMTKEDIAQINNPQISSYITDIRTGKESFSEVKMILGAVLGFMIYFFIFFFGGQIMRSVSEEKTSRIVEVLISSVKSIYLLFGKIIAVALVGLTQLGLWIMLSALLLGGLKIAKPDLFAAKEKEKIELNQRIITADKINTMDINSSSSPQIAEGLSAINVPLIAGMFLLYFLLGYLLYGALFGAVGSLIDDDADAGQFSLPITIPLIFAMICTPIVMQDPSSSVASWLSLIPFTSPMIMLVRIPYGVPVWQLYVSVILLILTVAASMYIAAKIYRKGILMFGKQIKYKDLFKWIKTK